MSHLLKKGSSGAGVVQLQQNLVQLGYDLTVDGKFGPATEQAIKDLQHHFGYTVDGLVGDGTLFLVNQQLGYNWNRKTAPRK